MSKKPSIWGVLFIAPFIILIAFMIMQSPSIKESDLSGCYHDANANIFELRDGRIESTNFKASTKLEYHKLKPYLHVVPRIGLFAPYMIAEKDDKFGAIYELKTAGSGHVVGVDFTDRTGEVRLFMKGNC